MYLKHLIKKISQICLITISFVVICYSFTVYIHTKNQTQHDLDKSIDKQYIQTCDNYDSNGVSIFDFFNEKDSLDKMKGLYSELTNNKTFDILEINNQYIEKYSNEKYKDGIKFVYLEDEMLMNQVIKTDSKEEYMTPLKAVQINEYSAQVSDLKNSIYEGSFLKKSDYVLDSSKEKEIPVLLGNYYTSVYKIGDVIKGELFSKEFDFKVQGFFNKDTYYNKGGIIENLDTSIVMPFVSCSYMPNDEKESMFQRILYSMKISPFIKYKTKNHYTKCIDELETLYKEYDIDYRYIPNSIINLNNDALKQIVKSNNFLFIASTIIILANILLISLLATQSLDSKENYVSINKSDLFKSKFKVYFELIIYFIVASIISINYLKTSFKGTVYQLDFAANRLGQYICICIFSTLIIVLFNKINSYKKSI